MKAKVFVSLKSGVLDPQGKAIQHSVELLGYSGISDVRQGKYFEITLDGTVDNTVARSSVEKIALMTCITEHDGSSPAPRLALCCPLVNLRPPQDYAVFGGIEPALRLRGE